MRRFLTLFACATLALTAQLARACESDAVAIFSCAAANDRKFIELCAGDSSAPDGRYLQYRFGALDRSGAEQRVELEFPAQRGPDTYKRFMGATYTVKGLYTQSVRFITGDYSYRVYTESKGTQFNGAGVEVRNLKTGKVRVVECSDTPRFYIDDLKGRIVCDPDTPAGQACIK